MENNQQQMAEKKAATSGGEAKRNVKVYIPTVDIYETKENFVLVADLPGADDKSVDITVEKNILTINATTEPLQFKDHECSLMEYDTGDYRRSFVLSGDIDKDKIEAKVKDGVLSLTFPKTEEVKVKKITIH